MENTQMTLASQKRELDVTSLNASTICRKKAGIDKALPADPR